MRLKQTAETVKHSSFNPLPTTRYESITALVRQVRQSLAEEIKSAWYYEIIYDSTPDVSHRDQMSQLYIKIDRESQENVPGTFLLSRAKGWQISLMKLCNA